MGKKLEDSICRSYWLGRAQFSKTAMAKRMAYTAPVDDELFRSGAEGDEKKGISPVPSAPGPIPEEEEV
jgi:hypothetical protein